MRILAKNLVKYVALAMCFLMIVGWLGNQQALAQIKELTRVDLYGDPENLDPILKDKMTALVLNTAIFEKLVLYDVEKKEIVSQLAEDWTISEDGKTYTFYIRKGAKFHNGREITAQDFKYSYERLLNPDSMSPLSDFLMPILGAKEFAQKQVPEVVGIRVPEPYTLVILLEKANPTFLRNLSLGVAAVVPKEEVERLGADFGMKPVGSGPYVFDSWVKDSKVVLKANEDYWAGKPEIDVLTTLIVQESGTRDAMFAAGQIDYMLIEDPQYLRYSRDPRWKDNLVEVPELYTRHIAFNVQKAPFDNKLVRQAINHAIDRVTLVQTVCQNKAYPATGLFPPSLMGYDPELKGYDYNPEKAKDLLKQAGYENGFEFEILCTDHAAWGLPIVEAIQPYLKKVGISVKPVLVEWGVMMDLANAGDFEAYMYSVNGEAHPFDWLQMFHSDSFGGGGNRMRYINPKVDKLIDSMHLATTDEEVINLVREVERIIVDDAPWWFFQYNKAVMVHQPWVKGLIPNPVDMDYQPFDKLTIEK